MSDSLRGIRLFVAAYEERSFTAAAKRENATQSGVSQHIRKLEEGSGVRLFIRGASSVSPTPAGDGYYRKCLDILRVHQEAETALHAYDEGFSGEIRVGIPPTLIRRAIAPALSRFLDLNPNIIVDVTEAESAILTRQVLAGELDFAVVPALPNPLGLKVGRFLRTPEVLVSSKQSRLEPLVPIRLRDLGPIRVVLPKPQNTRRTTLDTYFVSAEARIQRYVELDAMLGTLDMVLYGDWFTILPGVMFTPLNNQDRFKLNPLCDPPLFTELVVIEPARRSLAPAAEAFCALLKLESERINAIWTEPAA
ncbi:LysR family transcriptional regulator [Aquabacter cavernae]|uniref:LysR family transcriptional regulator n=1 Tax=Aquabacter cavernae TaxID=2496029 RepID=UPI001FE0098F|nr:LysR family transcriptional regulator [Aquabacter cavernae]